MYIQTPDVRAELKESKFEYNSHAKGQNVLC